MTSCSIEKYQDSVVTKELTPQDLDETPTLVIEVFSQRVSLYGLMHAPPILEFNIHEFVLMLGFCEFNADFNSLFVGSKIIHDVV